MRCFDPLVRADAISQDDLANLAYFGVDEVVLVSHTPHLFSRESGLAAYWYDLLAKSSERFERAGITTHVALGVLPGSLPRAAPGIFHKLSQLPRRERLVALGELRVSIDDPRQWEIIEKQVDLFPELPLIIRVMGRFRMNMVYTLTRKLGLWGVDPSRVALCGIALENMDILLQDGFHLILSVGPSGTEPVAIATPMRELIERVGEDLATRQVMLTGDVREGSADVLAMPRAVEALERAGFAEELIARLCRENARALFATSRAPTPEA